VATRVDTEGLRPVARAIGLDPAAILKFLRGSKPRASTRQKLERWYVEARIPDVLSPDAARAALDILVQDLPPGDREQALKEAIKAFRAIYQRAKAPQPGWITELEKGSPDASPT
jgi:hypothetical protein